MKCFLENQIFSHLPLIFLYKLTAEGSSAGPGAIIKTPALGSTSQYTPDLVVVYVRLDSNTIYNLRYLHMIYFI